MTMSKGVDYYFAPSSPWAYLGHERFLRIAAQTGASVQPRPVDYGKIFPLSGGLPLKHRAAQRQAYRFSELKRWRAHLDLPLTLEPKFFPVDANPANHLLAVALTFGVVATLRLAGDLMRACWAEERDIADEATLVAIATAGGLDGSALLAASRGAAATAAYDQFTQQAVDAQVFGAPTYVFNSELFWGQDRLDFLERALAS